MNRKSPGGQLFSNFKYRHDILTKETGIRKNNQKILKVEKAPDLRKSDITPEVLEEIRTALIGRTELWNRISLDWRKTCADRRNEILKLEVSEVFARWPKYKHKRAVDLVSFKIYKKILYSWFGSR